MKTERRHELQHNQLADWIGNQVGQVQQHTKTILAAVILGSAVIIAAFVILSDRKAAQAAAWTEFNLAFSSRDPVALADVAKRHTGTDVALWARQAQADLELNRGIAALYSNREEAMLALSDARKAYTEVIAGATSNPEIMQHALFGLAQAQEASGNLDGARDYYEQVVKRYPDSVMGKDAAARLAAIKNPEIVKWYNWFAKQKPRPSSPLSMPNLPGMPDDLTKLPDMPNLPAAPEGGPVSPPTDVPNSELPPTTPPPGIPTPSTATPPTPPVVPSPETNKKPGAPDKPAVPAPGANLPLEINPPAPPNPVPAPAPTPSPSAPK